MLGIAGQSTHYGIRKQIGIQTAPSVRFSGGPNDQESKSDSVHIKSESKAVSNNDASSNDNDWERIENSEISAALAQKTFDEDTRQLIIRRLAKAQRPWLKEVTIDSPPDDIRARLGISKRS